MLNLGSGRTRFPGPRPEHHTLVPEALYSWPEWLNISKNAREEPDCVMDLFTYPWDLPSDTFEGALCAHICEHIPHEIRLQQFRTERTLELEKMQDGWYAFFSELYRVLKPGAMVHILAPHAFSQGAYFDPSHTRGLLPETFNHSMKPDPDAPFGYENGGLHFETRAIGVGITPYFEYLTPRDEDTLELKQQKQAELERAVNTRVNVIAEFYVRLECIK